MPIDALDSLRPEPRRRERVPGDRRRRRDERVRPVIEVEQRALGALEQHVLTVAQRLVQQRRRVGDVRLEPLGVAEVVLHDPVGVERQPAVDLREDLVLLSQDDLELLAEDLLVEEVLDAQPDAGGLVGVRGADAALRRAQRVLPEEPLGHLLELQVVRHDQVRVAADTTRPETSTPRRAGARPSPRAAPRVDDHAVGDHRRDVGVQDAATG